MYNLDLITSLVADTVCYVNSCEECCKLLKHEKDDCPRDWTRKEDRAQFMLELYNKLCNDVPYRSFGEISVEEVVDIIAAAN